MADIEYIVSPWESYDTSSHGHCHAMAELPPSRLPPWMPPFSTTTRLLLTARMNKILIYTSITSQSLQIVSLNVHFLVRDFDAFLQLVSTVQTTFPDLTNNLGQTGTSDISSFSKNPFVSPTSIFPITSPACASMAEAIRSSSSSIQRPRPKPRPAYKKNKDVAFE